MYKSNGVRHVIKGKLVGIKISEQELEVIDKAAAIESRPRSSFMRKAATDVANKVIGI